jgi:UDP-2-acetamido-2,6-beta-L-arabino-hexul-4-ose reductase
MTAAVVLTGAAGFLGWHVRVLARALGWPAPVTLDRVALADPDRLGAAIDGADRVVHLAGVNRGTRDEVVAGTADPAAALSAAVRRCRTPPKVVAFANSVQAGNGTPYGDAKATAAATLAESTRWSGSTLADVRLPNIFGEHGRPNYNSVVATFCRALADGRDPEVLEDRPLDLLHATDAAASLLGVEPEAEPERWTVGGLAARLREFARLYRTGDIPDLAGRFEVRLFNTYRSHCFPEHYPIRLPSRDDQRGELVEVVRAHGRGGQTFYSVTRPGATRGQHFHLAKIERFVVVRGRAEIGLRRLFHDDVVRFRVDGGRPAIVDMPTMWAHDIRNVGDEDLLTLFWCDAVFDPARPDTYPEAVGPEAVS